MLFNVALFSVLTLLVAPVVLAVPFGLRAPVARRLNAARAAGGTKNTTNWGGAVFDKDNETFSNVTATFTVPKFSGEDGSGVAFGVGIDGDTCVTCTIQASIIAIIEDGIPTYGAYYEWLPTTSSLFSDFNISAEDVVKLTVVASSPNSGTVTIENLSTGQHASESLYSSIPLCGQNAEWIVAHASENGTLLPLADFGTVTFTGAVATGPGGTVYTPDYATTVEMVQNDTVLTHVWTTDNSVMIRYEPSS